MEFMIACIAVILVVGSIIGSIVGNMIASELYDHAPSLAVWLVERAASQLPEPKRNRYREEWLAHLDECPGKLGKLYHALGCWLGARTIARANNNGTSRPGKRALNPSSDVTQIAIFDSISFRTSMLDTIIGLSSTDFETPVYCTSSLEFFVCPDGQYSRERQKIRTLNQNIFEKLAATSLRTDSAGFRLLVHYEDDLSCLLKTELQARYSAIARAATLDKIELDQRKFLIRRIPQKLDNQFYVIGRHVFKVVKKGENPDNWRYIRVTNQAIADVYRDWLADLFMSCDQTDKTTW